MLLLAAMKRAAALGSEKPKVCQLLKAQLCRACSSNGEQSKQQHVMKRAQTQKLTVKYGNLAAHGIARNCVSSDLFAVKHLKQHASKPLIAAAAAVAVEAMGKNVACYVTA